MNQLRQQIHTLREVGISNVAIARLAGVDSSLISRYASGKTNATPATEAKIASAIQTIKEVVSVA